MRKSKSWWKNDRKKDRKKIAEPIAEMGRHDITRYRAVGRKIKKEIKAERFEARNANL